MCLLSYYPPNVEPNADRLVNGAKKNSDGSGYAIVTKNAELLTGRSMKADKVLEEFLTLRAQEPEGPAMFHSRFGTGGSESVLNCHPFQVGHDRRTVLAHNGIFFSVGRKERRSDTRIFAEQILPGKRFRARLDGKKTRNKLESYMGYFNKVVVLTVNPRYAYSSYIFNEQQGVWTENGEWHSNYDFEKPLKWYEEEWEDRYPGFIGTDGLWHPGTSGGAHNDDYGYVDCDNCGAFASVDPDTFVCAACHVCFDCGIDELDCQCYNPGKRDSGYWAHDRQLREEAANRMALTEASDIPRFGKQCEKHSYFNCISCANEQHDVQADDSEGRVPEQLPNGTVLWRAPKTPLAIEAGGEVKGCDEDICS